MRIATVGLAAALLAVPLPAMAQNIEGRVGRLESEMRAVQRKVFPGGAGQTLQPEITAPNQPIEQDGVPATSAIADLTQRVTSLESQMASMTDQIEQAGYRQRQLQQAFEAYKRDTDAKLAALAGPAPIAPATGSAPLEGDDAATPTPAPSRPTTRPAPSEVTPPIDRPSARGETTAAASPKPTGVVKPSTGDTPEDEYLYGYRLWQAKQYPEAEAQLKKVVATYPKHRRASFAQNLLGRAYLDEGKPSLASMAFYDNYKKMPDGERAPESLYYLAQALVQLKKPADACKVYGELTDVYGAKISAGMKADVAKGRAAAKCN
ncbi:TolA-binding protein [Sphingomonas jinjuensis]|uniref:TolA-binding protein n=1 Tax=Sphingomonas jinjuensis TaxID=535907 RepID=A0A840FGK7_9SPHN|nr:hypothetical protein [Sphingomonas jinjuensis]MBB4154797.1 TolA-binding protein [Sphingomonas jinjuensis]